ncbi:MAG: VOC family protein [Dehalococcoidales bacterium]|nr:VOC family protein [Dehalococcoidales bacterium]
MDKEKWPYSQGHEMFQIGVVVRDLERAIKYYESLGIGPFKTTSVSGWYREMRGKPAPDIENRVAVARLGPVDFELVQPVSGHSIQQEFLDKHGEGINHLGFRVDDLDNEIAEMEKKGFKGIYSTRGAKGDPIRGIYLATDTIGGILFELVRKR